MEHRLLGVASWQLIVGALTLLLLAVGMEQPFFTHDPVGGSVIFEVPAAAELLKEIAFALIIATIVSEGIERRARADDAENAHNLRRMIAEDVFAGVFSSSLPPEYVNRVIQVNLKPELLREVHQVTYTIRPLTPAELEFLKAPPDDFIILHAIHSYRLRNIAGKTIEPMMRFSLPRRSGRLAHFTKIHRLECGSRKLAGEEIDAVTRVAPEGTTLLAEWREPEFKPGETRDFIAEWTAIKNSNGTDVWGSLYPSMRFSLSVHVQVPGTIFGAATRAATGQRKIYDAPDRGEAHWEVDGPMLPNDSVTFWWRQSEERYSDGAPEPGQRLLANPDEGACVS